MTFVLVVILQSFTLYCVDASFISGRAMDCTIFEKVVSGLFPCNFFGFQVAIVICDLIALFLFLSAKLHKYLILESGPYRN